jgi:hypothetical protein
MGGLFTLENASWKSSGSGVIPSGSLVATVLCNHHNSILTPYDLEVGKLVRHLVLLDSKTTAEGLAEVPATLSINGIYLEKWLLKVLCGIMASGNFLIDMKPVGKVQPSEYLVNLLFSGDSWTHSVGLYANYVVGTTVDGHRGVAYDTVVRANRTQNGTHVEIVGVDVRLWGLLVLRGIFGTVDGPELLSRYRPQKLQILNRSVTRDIVFTWPPGSVTTQGITLTRTGTVFPEKTRLI